MIDKANRNINLIFKENNYKNRLSQEHINLINFLSSASKYIFYRYGLFSALNKVGLLSKFGILE